MNLSMIQTTNQNESEHEWDSAVESVAPLQQPKHTDRTEEEQMIFMSPQTHRNSKSFVAFGKDEVNDGEVHVGAYDDSLSMVGMLTQKIIRMMPRRLGEQEYRGCMAESQQKGKKYW